MIVLTSARPTLHKTEPKISQFLISSGLDVNFPSSPVPDDDAPPKMASILNEEKEECLIIAQLKFNDLTESLNKPRKGKNAPI
jgi:hypothetical protein